MSGNVIYWRVTIDGEPVAIIMNAEPVEMLAALAFARGCCLQAFGESPTPLVERVDFGKPPRRHR